MNNKHRQTIPLYMCRHNNNMAVTFFCFPLSWASAALLFAPSALALHSSIMCTESLKPPVMRRIMQAKRRMLNQGWSKQLDAVQLCMRSPDCSFFSYLANSNSPVIHWSFLSLSLQLAANSLSLPPRVSEPEVGGVAASLQENLSGMLGGVASEEARDWCH